MMSDKIISEQQAAARLLAALDETDELSHEQAEAQIPALVEAEQAGEDVDRDPQYAALLRHLDRCESCMELYTGLAEDLMTVAGEAPALPETKLTPPSFFGPARQSENVVLRILRGLTRRFELTLTPARLVPAIPNLGSGQRAEVFADRLPEVSGEPLVAVTLNAAEESVELLVALREARPGSRWQVQLTADEMTYTETTDDRGIARFSGLPRDALQKITLLWSELPAKA